MTARLNSKFRKISIVQCYAPTEPDDNETKAQFYSQPDSVTRSLSKGDFKLFMGDFNAKVGNNSNNLQSIMGIQGFGDTRNDNSDRMVDFCPRNRLLKIYTNILENNQMKTPVIKSTTYFLGSLMSVKTRRGADIDNDPMLLVVTLRLRRAVMKRTQTKTRKFHLLNLKDPETVREYKATLTDKLQNNTHTWADITTAYTETATSIIGTARRSQKPWISNETIEEIRHRKCLRNALLWSKSSVTKLAVSTEYRAFASLVKRQVRRVKRIYFNMLAEQAENEATIGNMCGYYESVKQMSDNNIRPTAIIKDEDR
uniref:Endonuclease/exonuclease/phosphatase domain-containing protein n=1 Tax=Stomoxys calcitrans TaxID=35570 RepID=A0A1I8PZS5_STOCA